MEFTNEVLRKIEGKQKFNVEVSKYFYRLDCDYGLKGQHKYLRISNNVKNCLNYWLWDKYKYNKVLDLKKVSRCKNRFCSNCKKFDLSRALNNLSPHFKKLLNEGYNPFLVTLTIPNCSGDDLFETLNKMQVAFRKFYRFYSLDGKGGYDDRYFKFYACVRCLEVTYSKERDDFHPHYHLMVFIKGYKEFLFYKYIEGEWSNKRGSYNMYSDFDMQIRKIWTLCYKGKTVRDYDKLDDIYIGEIREMDEKGIYEVMKYAFKDTDIVNYKVFSYLYFALYGRRLRQGYGFLYNVRLENDSDGKKQGLDDYLLINKEELPSEVVTTQMKTLYNEYSNYIKISRFNKDKYINSIE